MQQERRKLVVFWEGTANTLNPLTTQIGLFSKVCRASAVESAKDVEGTHGPLKISFDGCGVTHGNWGVLFANGLDEQCQVVVEIVQKMNECQAGSTTTGVHVVAVGLSRGGIACMKLARALSKFPESQVTVSTLLFDPVPGNAVSTGFPWTACSAFDLSQCHNLKRVLALYPFEALPDIAMHAPTLGRYNPKTTLVQEDVTMGCHQGALLMPNIAPPGQHPEFSLRRILDYLECEGVSCSKLPVRLPTPHECIDMMEYIKRRPPTETLRRKTHDERRRKILRHANAQTEWLNRHHEQLVRALEMGNKTSTMGAVFGYPGSDDSGSYQLDFDDGYVLCPSPFTPK